MASVLSKLSIRSKPLSNPSPNTEVDKASHIIDLFDIIVTLLSSFSKGYPEYGFKI